MLWRRATYAQSCRRAKFSLVCLGGNTRVSSCAVAVAGGNVGQVHERYLQKLFSHLRSDPPKNFMRVTTQQVMMADRQVFMFMIKEDVSLRRLPGNTLQMDTLIMEALRSYEVSFHLVPLSKTAAPEQEHLTPTVAPYGKGKGKGKKGKGKKQVNVLPKALQDNAGQNDHARR